MDLKFLKNIDALLSGIGVNVDEQEFVILCISCIGCCDGTLTKVIQAFKDNVHVDPDELANKFGAGDLEDYLDTHMVHKVYKKYVEVSSSTGMKVVKAYRLKPHPDYNHLIDIQEDCIANRERKVGRRKAQSYAVADQRSREEGSIRFRLHICKLLSIEGGEADFVKFQNVQTAYERAFDEPLTGAVFRKFYSCGGPEKNLRTRFFKEFYVRKEDNTGCIELKLKAPFSEIKKNIIEELKRETKDDVNEAVIDENLRKLTVKNPT
ncbi:hypothetical protein L596_029198 [Steinernema carpocapsae]|uniref:Uncharacterized protein n=1 Tax=Steinernema carpocapsae TaxID=34508 RepID=A0A4U5LTX8_STECR|nr:hypothetical protein L596_029198 [Steinernema carpocapsae]